MNIRDLEYLLSVAELGHFGKAADACFVSQPALSMQIKKLEENLGVKLLERTHKSVLLTDHGVKIAKQARQILDLTKDIKDVAKSAKDPFGGEIRIGIFPTLAPYFLPVIIPKLSKTYPKLSFYLIEEKTATLIEQLQNGKLDAAFLAFPVIEKNFRSALLFEEEFLLATPKKHPLAKLKYVGQNDLKNEELLLLNEGHCMRDQALAVCNRIKIHENQNFRATSLETLRHMISAGVGITLMPKLACTESTTISYIPFSTPKSIRSIGLFWRVSLAKQVLLKHIVNEIKLIFKDREASVKN